MMRVHKPSMANVRALGASSARTLQTSAQVRRDNHRSVYGSTAWRNLSLLARSFMPTCCRCRRRRTQVADHVHPIGMGGNALDLMNTQGLCDPCNRMLKHCDIGHDNPNPQLASISCRDWRSPIEKEAIAFFIATQQSYIDDVGC